MKPTPSLSAKVTSLIDLANYWQANMKAIPHVSAGLITLLEEFSQFAGDYSKTFGNITLFSPKLVGNRTAEHLLQTFNILSRASEQRRGDYSSGSMESYLLLAEEELGRYCKRWQPGNDKDNMLYTPLSTPVVYFEKLYGITRAMFTPEIPVISIPFTDYDKRDSWQALAHELGHSLYWNSLCKLEDVERFHERMLESVKNAVQKARKDLKRNESIDPWGGWIEEVFADIYGTLLNGTRYLVSCQEFVIEQTRSVKDLAKNDGEHPSLHLRPIICAQVMQKISMYLEDKNMQNKDLQNALVKLEQRWNEFSATAGTETCKGTQIKLKRLAQEVTPVVDAILQVSITPGGKTIWDSVDFYGKTGLDDTERQFLQNLQFDQPIIPEFFTGMVRAPEDSDIPDRLKELWGYLENKIDDSSRERDETKKAIARWNTLLDLSLDDTHTHFVAHGYCTTHLFVKNHKHSADTGLPVDCQ